ncbi:MAG: hypothetical protein ACRCXZ_07695, partial [Patescibacteria group bacterium]
ENNNYKQALETIYNCLTSDQEGFMYRTSEKYLEALEFLKTCIKYSQYSNPEHIQNILRLIITTGDAYTAYDISPKAPWWNYYNQLKFDYPKDWSKNYQIIIKTLKSKNLTKQILAICEVEEDVTHALVYADSKDAGIRLIVSRIIMEEEPVKSLEIMIKYYRYNSYFEYRDSIDLVRASFAKLKKLLPEDKQADLSKLVQKVEKDIKNYDYLY